MRLIDADKINFNEIFIGASDFAQDTRNVAQTFIDSQPTVIDGRVTEAKYVYQQITYVLPLERHYEKLGETPYIKYCCPVCEALGNPHQVIPDQANCSLCNVNLNWEN